MYKKYVVRLTEEQRSQLETLVRRGRAHARKLLYARILLKADADGPDRWTDERIADALEVSTATVARERRRFLQRRSKALTHIRSWARLTAVSCSIASTTCRFNRSDECCRGWA